MRSVARWLLSVVFLIAQPVLAASLDLAWDAVNHPSVAVYEVHYGLASGQYQSSADSITNSISVTGLQTGTTYYFAVRACDAARVQCSAFSNEVSATTTAAPPVASLDTSLTTGYAPLTVAFTDSSTGSVTGQHWQFGDGDSASNAGAVTHTYTTPGSYQVQLTVTGPGGADSATQTIVVLASESNETGGDAGDPPPDDGGSQEPPPSDDSGSNGDAGSGGSGILIEIGEIEIDDTWQRVDFDNTFVDPVVVMKPLAGTDDEPAVIRIDAVEPTGFMVRVQEWDHLDGVHAPEKASYIVMERGTHQLPDGSWVEAGTVDIKNFGSLYRAFISVPLTAPFTTKPVVTAAVNTVNDAQAVTVRLRGARTDRFEMMLAEGEAFDQVHATETVAFIAWEPSVGMLDGRPYEVGTINNVTQQGREIVFNGTYASPPAFVADMQTTSGYDPANVRWLNKSETSVKVWIDEEDSKDAETAHYDEQIGYFVFGSTSSSDNGGDSGSGNPPPSTPPPPGSRASRPRSTSSPKRYW